MFYYLYQKSTGIVKTMSEKPFEFVHEDCAVFKTDQKKETFPILVHQDGILRLATAPEIENIPQADYLDDKAAEKKAVKERFDDDSANGVLLSAVLATMLYEINLMRNELKLNPRAEADVRNIFREKVDEV